MLCRQDSIKGGFRLVDSVPVYLNVYDLTPINGYAYWLGLGVYHSGVQVHGVEYAFGAHEYPTTGIFEGEPKQCEGFTFRKSIIIGRTAMGPEEVAAVMEELGEKYKGNAYNLITKNCNHFCNDACLRLTGNPIPSWVNRLARIGLFCNCIIPVRLKSARFRHERIEDKVSEEDREKLRSSSNGLLTSSSNSSSSSSSSPVPETRRHRGRSRSRSRRSALPSSPLIIASPPPI
ncbi:hypothetical protein NMG60_11002750 [Bertholletia excelsa]